MEEAASEVRKKQKRQTTKKKKKKQRVKTDIPIEIVKEILDRLPLKSLARFKCVSKRWHSLAKTIIRQRFREEWRRVMPKYLEARRSMDDLNGGGAEDSDEEFGAGRARLRDGLEEMQSVVGFLDGIDRYLPERGDAYHMLRDSAVCWVRRARDLLADVDAFSDAEDDSD